MSIDFVRLGNVYYMAETNRATRFIFRRLVVWSGAVQVCVCVCYDPGSHIIRLCVDLIHRQNEQKALAEHQQRTSPYLRGRNSSSRINAFPRKTVYRAKAATCATSRRPRAVKKVNRKNPHLPLLLYAWYRRRPTAAVAAARKVRVKCIHTDKV